MDKYIKESELFKRILNVDFKHDYDGCIKFCQSIPTADVVEVKHGRWIPIKRGEVGYSAGDFKCTECGKPNKCYSMTPYCPNCGAKMNEVEE